MNLHGLNYANAETTRTPLGGAYKYKKRVCNPKCKTVEESKFFKRYIPNHPDADTNGYVTFPEIDKNKELAWIESAAKTISLIAKECRATVKVIKNIDSMLLKYSSGIISHDVLNFNKAGRLISWVRETSDGNSSILNF